MTTRFRRSAEAMSADVGDDVVALHVPRGFAYGMEGVTAAVWQMLGEPRSEPEIISNLLDNYEVDEAQCRADILELLDEMVAEGLVERIEG